ncbi:amidase [Kineococcus rhizosphaerae]|uniref:Asp-tRNA(Asn)/Glu-tRNA(Gln) amidotransferase A subunit family amidase n=1 Tax=Kineococcus rhizosphaerae TaxID=559628 RepID=A0A2T0R3S4_9ACTN|nr:amidase [Kineococcus rhizosphaerae]PRY14643.1 Asp-tRNA(Asn)/Glu-tRNA(Gln) amidotransferase A subunit family amidase [Kineococcus rhizosphaerae]
MDDLRETHPFAELTITRFHRMLRAGEATSAELTAWYLQRVEDLDRDGPRLGSLVTLNPAALDQARAADDHFSRTGRFLGPLHGVPIVVKDQAETAGIPTAFGCSLFADHVPEQDATVVARLRAAGAVVLGKTAMCDFAAGWFSFSSRTGFTRNPYDLERETGGSSAGTAAAVAADLALVGLGEDTGGSIRLPASFTNLFGLRPTTGLVSRTGFSPLVHFQDTPGPMARTVTDAAVVLDVIAGWDPQDEYTALAAGHEHLGAFAEDLDSTDLASFRVGVLEDAFGTGPESAGTNSVVRAALDRLRAEGTGVVEGLELGDLHEWVTGTSLYTTQSKQDLAAFLAARPGVPATSWDEIVAAGAFHPLTDLVVDIAAGPEDPRHDPEYLPRRLRQEDLRRRLTALMAGAGVDVLVYPTVQVPAPTREELAAKRWTALTFPTNTVLASQSSLPAASVPVGFTDDGLPVGLEVVGPVMSERRLLRFARAWERAVSPRRAPHLSSAGTSETPGAAEPLASAAR